jgi:hypothetical protein
MTRSMGPSPFRRAREDRRRGGGAAWESDWPAALVAWLLARPFVDRLLSALLRMPRALMATVAVAGLALTVLAIVPLMVAWSAPSSTHEMNGGQMVPSTAPPDRPAEQEAVLAVVAGYNQASIAAGLLARADLLAPYLAPDGTAWRDVQDAYEQRRARGETTDAGLQRWGVLEVQVTGDTARVKTQEQWDAVTSVGGEIVSSRRGVLTRNTYHLRRSPQASWLIVSVDSTTLIS